MKLTKVLCLILALTLVFGLLSCGKAEQTSLTAEKKAEDTKESIKTIALEETVSTDIIDFTLKEACFSYYAGMNDEGAKPVDEAYAQDKPRQTYSTAKGRVLVCMTFEVSNNDRKEITIGDGFDDWFVKFKIEYKGKTYDINGYDLNEKDGNSSWDFLHSYTSIDNGETWSSHRYGNLGVGAGETTLVRTFGIAVLDPDSLDDPFTLTVNVPSSGEMEYFTYQVG